VPGLSIQIIVGLGNPGREYETTRHNAGFWLVEELARRHGGKFRLEPRFSAEVARIRLGGRELWLAKPQDYMNNSGRVTAAVMGFYKLPPADLLVAYDELDLPVGDVRLKSGGGAGGHNGLRHGHQMRHRRSAQRRQVHPLQRAHQGADRGGELSVLHHRSQCRRRPVPDPRLDEMLPAIVKPKRVLPPSGGVRRHRRPGGGRQQGRRPGQQVPRHIRETDAIAHVVRCFENETWTHVAGKVDPISDIESSTPSWPWPTWPASRRPGPPPSRQGRRQGSRAQARAAGARLRERLDAGQAGALRCTLEPEQRVLESCANCTCSPPSRSCMSPT
jgi:aminoacyl-tRNA hydrolase